MTCWPGHWKRCLLHDLGHGRLTGPISGPETAFPWEACSAERPGGATPPCFSAAG